MNDVIMTVISKELMLKAATELDEKNAELTRRDELIAELLAALEPFAAIALEHDDNPEGPDCISAPDLAITPSHVRKARAAIDKATPHGGGRRA